MSKPVHPLAFPNNPRFQDPDDNNLHSDFEFSDVSEPIEAESVNRSNTHKRNLHIALVNGLARRTMAPRKCKWLSKEDDGAHEMLRDAIQLRWRGGATPYHPT